MIECRDCKRALTSYISSEMLSTCTTYLTPHQALITNIGERAYSVTGNGTPQPQPILRCNTEEADLRTRMAPLQALCRKYKTYFQSGHRHASHWPAAL